MVTVGPFLAVQEALTRLNGICALLPCGHRSLPWSQVNPLGETGWVIHT